MHKYTAETFAVITSGETGHCVKLGDDTVCDVYCGHNGSGLTGGMYGAERIAAALNTIEGIPTFALQSPDPNTAGPYSLAVLRETLRDLVQQFYNNDTEGLAHSIALVEMNVSMLSGEG